MKKSAIVLLLFFFSILSYSQKAITTEIPCTDEMAQNAKGRWIKSTDLGTINSKDAFNRLDEIKDMMLKIYQQPTGVDAVWHRSAGVSYFGSKHKYYKTSDDRLTFDYSNLPHFFQYAYNAGFFRYQCEYNKTHSLLPGYPGETGTWINIIANTTLGEMAGDDSWTINGMPVIMRKPVIKKIEGVEFLHPEPGYNVRHVLVYRKGTLPYKPVTRKQYLEYCITYHSKLWDEAIKTSQQIPVRPLEEQEKEKREKLAKFEKDFGKDPKRLKSAVDYYLSGYKTDQQTRDEQVASAKKNKEQELKKITDELEKTTREGLLDSPAIVLVKYQTNPVFERDPAKGLMLVSENPDYIRKDLPKHIPQLFIVSWTWNDWMSQKRVAEIIEQSFPFEKLQQMIDK